MTQTPYAPPETNGLEADKKLCSTCQAVIHKNAEICPKCGVRQRKPANKTTLLLLIFFFGGFGAHRFYLGNTILGIVYLLFFWTGIPGLIALIEFIVFIFISRETIEEDYTAHNTALAIIIPIIIIMIVGILAAVAIPAYTDYMKKAQVAEAMLLLSNLKTPAADYYAVQGTFPPSVDSIKGQTSGQYTANIISAPYDFYFEATMRDDLPQIGGKTVRMIYNPNSSSWTCSPGYPDGLDNRYLPSSCRN